jgi:hypothetical protein
MLPKAVIENRVGLALNDGVATPDRTQCNWTSVAIPLTASVGIAVHASRAADLDGLRAAQAQRPNTQVVDAPGVGARGFAVYDQSTSIVTIFATSGAGTLVAITVHLEGADANAELNVASDLGRQVLATL